MRHMPIYFGDSAMSQIGTMLFPEDPQSAKTFVAHRLCKGPLQSYLTAGYSFADRQMELFSAIGATPLDEAEVDRRHYAGTMVGETVKVLWALICSHREFASWSAAVKIVEKHAGREAGSRTTLHDALREYAAVLHLWGAWSIRGRTFRREVGDDASAFLAEAGGLLIGLRQWRDQTNRPDDHSYLSVDEYGPWLGWNGPEELLAPVLGPLEDAADLRRPGRPRKNPSI